MKKVILLVLIMLNLPLILLAQTYAEKQATLMEKRAENARKGFFVSASAGYGFVGNYTVSDEAYVSFMFIPLSAENADSKNHMKAIKDTFVPTISLGYEGDRHGFEFAFRWDSIDARSSGYGYELNNTKYAEHITVESRILMLNYYYKFLNTSPLTPYLGLGAGYGWTTTNWEMKDEQGNVTNVNDLVNGGRHYGTFNYNVFLGAQYNLSQNITLGLDVNYMVRSGLTIEKSGGNGQLFWLQGGAGINRETGFISDVTTVSLKLKYYFI